MGRQAFKEYLRICNRCAIPFKAKGKHFKICPDCASYIYLK